MNAMNSMRHLALQFGHVKHFNEGLSEFSRQLAVHLAALAAEQGGTWQVHAILPKQWHGACGPQIQYHELSDVMRLPHRFPIDLDVWHGLHQHMRYRPPSNCRHRVITVHDLNHLYAKKGLSRWWQSHRLARQLRHADQLVAISQYAATDLSQHVRGIPPVQIIHNGAADLTRAKQDPIAALTGQRFMLHISRMSPSKNVQALIDMAAACPDAHLVLAGPESPEVRAHRAQLEQRRLRNVTFLTDVSEAQKAWLYAHCEAFLFPSLMEGFGLPPIEAMFFGKPVIVAKRTCLPEICGDAAAYWDHFGPQSMRSTVEVQIAKLAREPRQQEAVRQQARRYTWQRAAREYMALYQKGAL